jgi:hypothetical protein
MDARAKKSKLGGFAVKTAEILVQNEEIGGLRA